MFTKRRITQKVAIFFVLLNMTIPFGIVYGQGSDGVSQYINTTSGKVSMIVPTNGSILPASQALGVSALGSGTDPGMALAKQYGHEFGLRDPASELKVLWMRRSGNNRLIVRYQQNYEGIPVIGGELIVNTNENGDLYSINGEISANISLPTEPTIDSGQARQTALQTIAKWYKTSPANLVASEPELWIFDESLLRPSKRSIELVWRLEVASSDQDLPIRELVLINANRGNIALHFNQIDTGWSPYSRELTLTSSSLGENMGSEANHFSKPNDMVSAGQGHSALSPIVSTYTANNTASLPGAFLCNQAQPNCTNGNNPHADSAHRHAIGIYNLYATQYGRNSIDNMGMLIKSTVHYCDPNFTCPYENAFWSGTQMVYGDAYGFPLADDVVVHELTHGVTQYESNLFYFFQSGAINESFSDLWGEYYDQTNHQGNDSAGVKWLIGEDISGLGAIRNMSNPPAMSLPDKMSSPYYYIYSDDNGGVHTNSGINNKGVFLMVSGGTFNGRTITALGWDKTAAIYYEVNTNLLSSGADYSDLYFALQRACANLIGQKGITSANCVEVKDALDAVEMNAQPEPNFNTDSPYCDQGNSLSTTFADDFESVTGKWTFTNGAHARWQYDSPLGTYAHSGIHSLYASDLPEEVTDANVKLASFVVPGNAYMHFAQAYEFENILGFYFDGAVLEYSLNGGSTWVDARPLFNFNGYNGLIEDGYDNPLAGRSAFVGSSHGYISTRLNLASLAGKTVTFRWRMGLDFIGSGSFLESPSGWWLDDIKVYTCPAAANVSVTVGNSNMGNYIVPAQTSIRPNYAGLNNGVVKVVSTNNIPIVASQRVAYNNGSAWTSFSELMGLPANQLSSSYTFPWYNNLDLNSQLRFGNAGTANTTVTVTIGGVVRGSYPLVPNQIKRVSYVGLDKGPVKIQSSGGVPIIASLRVAYNNGSAWTSFSELMGLPSGQLTTTYLFPWYNNADLNSQLRFGNVGNANTTVTVIVGGVVKGSYPLVPNQSQRVSYADLNSGPVKVISSSGVPIIASVRVAYNNGSAWTNYSEMMGLPLPALSTSYSFPVYDNVNHDSQLRFGNVGTSNTTVTVTIGGVVKANYTLSPNASQRISYVGLNSGPVVIKSSDGVPIIASERVAYFNGSAWISFAELMGLPQSQLTTTYLFPWYNNLDLDTQLRFGVP